MLKKKKLLMPAHQQRTDGQRVMDNGLTDNRLMDDGHPIITIAHLEPMAQVR